MNVTSKSRGFPPLVTTPTDNPSSLTSWQTRGHNTAHRCRHTTISAKVPAAIPTKTLVPLRCCIMPTDGQSRPRDVFTIQHNDDFLHEDRISTLSIIHTIVYCLLYYIVLCYIMLYYIVLCYIILYCVILYYIELCYVILYYIILYYIVLCYVILYYIVLYYITQM